MADIVRKVCVCGDPSVGKTSLVRRFVHGKYEDKYISTLGTVVSKKSVKTRGDNVQMMIWDVSGQAEFKRIHQSAFKNATGAIAVCDITRPDTCQNLQEWISNIRNTAGNGIPVVILANKADLVDEESQILELSRMSNWNKEQNVFITSAKTGDNVEDAFKILAESISTSGGYMNAPSSPSDIEMPNDQFTPKEFLDYMAIAFCKVLGDEEMGMHVVRKQVQDEGFDFRRINKKQTQILIDRFVRIIERDMGHDVASSLKADLLKTYNRVKG